jgi:hypothetical protein
VLDGIESVYPHGEFIAQEGRGQTRKDSETGALAALSLYFITEVNTTAQSSESFSRRNGQSQDSVKLSVDTFVKSNASLFAVRYSAHFYDSEAKEYRVIGFIDRAEAWRIFEPRIKKEIDAFTALWDAAETETEAFSIVSAYRKLREYISRPDFVNTFLFGESLHPENMKTISGRTAENAAVVSAKTNEAVALLNIYIGIDHDFESLISAKLTKLFRAQHFNVSANKNTANTFCDVKVEEGFQHREGTGDFYYPKITVTIRSKGGKTLYSYAASAARQAASTPDVAKRRAYTALVNELEKNFLE